MATGVGMRYDGAKQRGGRVSNNESFIDEVTDEVRRDTLYATFRRYGWIAVLAVLVLVGAAGWSEYSKARNAAAAAARGDAIYDALQIDDANGRRDALVALAGQTGSDPVERLLAAAAQQESGDPAAAADMLDAMTTDIEVAPLYRDLAAFKALMLRADTLDPAARIAGFAQLAQPGAPFRLLALEQTALAQVDAGDTDAAIATLKGILSDAEVTRGLRERAQNLIVALGGTVDVSSVAPAN